MGCDKARLIEIGRGLHSARLGMLKSESYQVN